jgi:hypothetical protein
MTSYEEVKDDKERQRRHADFMLRMLREAGENGVLNRQFTDRVSHRFGGRIHDLRRKGHQIEKKSLGGGLWVYRLIEPARDAAQEGA